MARRAHSLTSLLAEVNGAYPYRDKTSDGWIGDAAHRQKVSDHNPNKHDVVQAQDFDEDNRIGDQVVGRALWNFLVQRRDPRVKYIIYEEKIVSSYATSSRKAWVPGPFSGNAHLYHVHLSVSDNPSLYDDGAPWGFTERWIMAEVLVYARKDSPNETIAIPAAQWAGAVYTNNKAEAASARKAGVKVVEVGGYGANVPQDIPGATWIRGSDRFETGIKCLQAARSW
jgi:hypothetical protein